MPAREGDAQASAVSAAVTSRPNAFATSQDFIAFDWLDDEAEVNGAGSSSSRAEPSAGPSRASLPRRPWPSHDGAGGQGASTAGVNVGKKRKLNDELGSQEDGLSKKQRAQAASRGTPWCADVDWDACRNPAEMLHRELMAFEHWLSPTPEEDETRRMVIQLIRRAITSRWYDAKVLSFGSQDTQLYLPQGDIDLVVVSDSMDGQRREHVLRSIAALLRRSNLATDVTVIARAKVPIVKFVCSQGRYRVDLSVNQTNGLQAAEYVKSWLRRQPALRPLIMATKVLLSQRGLSEVYSGGLGSYSVICMCISLFQLHPKLQRFEIDAARNLGVLFLEFLELYGKNFGYDHTAISLRGNGGLFDKALRGWLDGRRPWMLSIEDPQDASNDISKGSFQITAVRQVFSGSFDVLTAAMCQRAVELGEAREKQRRRQRAATQASRHVRFDADTDHELEAQEASESDDEDKMARDALRNESQAAAEANRSAAKALERDPSSFLGLILGVSRETFKARRDILDLYRSGTLQYMLGRPPPSAEPLPSAFAGPSGTLAVPPGPSMGKAKGKVDKAKAEPRPNPPQSNGAPSNGESKHEDRSKGMRPGRRPDGSREEPVIVLDSSNDEPLKRNRPGGPAPSERPPTDTGTKPSRADMASLIASVKGTSPGRLHDGQESDSSSADEATRIGESEDDEERPGTRGGSRYGLERRVPGPKSKPRRQGIIEEGNHVDEEAYVSDNSASSVGDSRADGDPKRSTVVRPAAESRKGTLRAGGFGEGGRGGGSSSTSSGGGATDAEARRLRAPARHAFWMAKAGGGRVDDDTTSASDSEGISSDSD